MTDFPALTNYLLDSRQGKQTRNEIKFLCPAHDDQRPSASYNTDKNTWHCLACGASGGYVDLHKRLNIPLPDNADFKLAAPKPKPKIKLKPLTVKPDFPFKPFRIYKDFLLKKIHAYKGFGFVVRYELDGNKMFVPFFEQDENGWKPGYSKTELRPLYNQHLLGGNDRTVFVVEGEKCADAITDAGGLAVTSPGGANAVHMGVNWEPLRNRKIILWPDNDAPGKKYTAYIKQKISSIAKSVDIVDPEELGLKNKQDVADWLPAQQDKKQALENIKLRDESAWENLLLLKKSGELEPSLGNLILIFGNHKSWKGKLAYNERSLICEFADAPPFDSKIKKNTPIEDRHASLCCLWLQTVLGIKTSNSKLILEALVTVCTQHSYDPVRDYFESLKWDGEDRLGMWLCDYAGVDNTLYTRAVARKFVISAVARTYVPGCKVDTMMILQGEQGGGKSTLLETLAGSQFFSDQIKASNEKDVLMLLHGPLIIEHAELDSLSRKEESANKSFITTKVDRFRPPYGMVVRSFPRTCVFAGSTNEKLYLKDPTGARRYWPVSVGEIDVKGLQAARDQLWAQAVAEYKNGVQWHMEQGTEEEQAKQEQSDRTISDPWEDKIATYAGSVTSEFIKSKDILITALDIPVAQQTNWHYKRAFSILSDLGWKQIVKKINGKATRVYLNPDVSENDCKKESEPVQTDFSIFDY